MPPTHRQNLDYLNKLGHSGIKLGLENTARILEYFGDPQLKIPTIHIAGTNGKGSTAAFTESILRAAGHRVGLYTSPHLLDFRERIQIDRIPVSPGELADLIDRVRHGVEATKTALTYFEFGTVMAFLHFADIKPDWNVIEVGLGGRLDATNLCRAQVSIITSISYDHQEHLGSDIKQIAFEKAAILKNNGTAFADSQCQEVMDVIAQVARERQAKIHFLGRDFRVERRSFGETGQTFDFYGRHRVLENLQISMLGHHQVGNAALAIAACLEIDSRLGHIPEHLIKKGLNAAHWEGRLEIVAHNPIIVLDGAHNPDGVKKMAMAIREHFRFKRCLVVTGIMRDKPIEKMAEILSGLAHHIILAKPRQERSADPEALREIFKKYNKHIEIIEEISYAIQTAIKLADPEDIICLTGSLFTIAEAKQYFANETFI